MPHWTACASVGTQTSMRAPMIAPPVSAATPSPYPGSSCACPSGITDGSTATMPGPTGIPVAVVPVRAYAVETTVICVPEAAGAAGAAASSGAATGAAAGGALVARGGGGLLRLLLRRDGLILERRDLRLGQPALRGKLLDVRRTVHARLLERRRRCFGLVPEASELGLAGRELLAQACEPAPGASGFAGDPPVERRHPVHVVEPGERIVERGGAEQDRERVDLTLLVEGANPVGEPAVRGRERATRDPEVAFRLESLAAHLRCLRDELVDP